MRPSVLRTARHRLVRAGLVLAVGIAAAGCVTFNGATTATQVAASGDVGTTLRYTVSVCSNGSTGAPGGPCAATFGGPGGTRRVVLAVLAPIGSVAPAVVTATLSTPVSVTRAGVAATRSDVQAFRTSSAAADFNADTPPPAGSTWVPYISEPIEVPGGTNLTADASIDIALPIDATGNPPASAARQVSVRMDSAPVVGLDPTAGQTDTLTYDCYVDANSDGTAETEVCTGALDPATPQAVAFRRLAITAPAAATVTAGSSASVDATVRLDGPALPTADVTVTASAAGSGLTATAPATATTVSGSDVTVPVTVAANASAQSGTLTVLVRTSNGTERTATVPVTVVAAPAPPAKAVDATRPTTTIDARRLANGSLRLSGRATDEHETAGLTEVKVQVVRGLGNKRCLAWNGTRFVRELCSVSVNRWVKLPLSIAPGTTSVDWSATTPKATPGLWLLRARSGDGIWVSRVATDRVTMNPPLPAR